MEISRILYATCSVAYFEEFPPNIPFLFPLQQLVTIVPSTVYPKKPLHPDSAHSPPFVWWETAVRSLHTRIAFARWATREFSPPHTFHLQHPVNSVALLQTFCSLPSSLGAGCSTIELDSQMQSRGDHDLPDYDGLCSCSLVCLSTFQSSHLASSSPADQPIKWFPRSVAFANSNNYVFCVTLCHIVLLPFL